MKKNVRKIILLCIIILITIVLCNITNTKRYISKNEDKQILPEDETISSKIGEKENFFDAVYEKTENLVNEERSSNNVVNEYSNIEPHVDTETGVKYVTYEDFGAYADGINDDYIPIRNAHIYANKNDYEVRATEGKQYHIFREEEYAPISIKTSTDWCGTEIVIHDENIVGKVTKDYPIFQIVSNIDGRVITDNSILKNIKLRKTTTRIPELSGNGHCLCIVYNEDKKQFIRFGLNENDGKEQQDVFKIDNEGNVMNEIQWNFDKISKIVLWPISDDKVTVQNGNFRTILPVSQNKQETGYYNRNIACYRSNCEINNIKHSLTNEESTVAPAPYYGFLKLVQVSDVKISNCKLTAHKYKHSSTYDLIIDLASNIEVNNVKQDNLEDNDRWGITGTNYTKDITYKNCELNRIDAHSGVHNLTIENSTLGKYGIIVVGSGILNLNNVTTLSPSTLVYLRDDYGSTWNGTINIKNCNMAKAINPQIVTFYTNYDNNNQPHNYGYDLYLPNITIDGLTINDNNNINTKYPDICIFDNNATKTRTDNGDVRNNYILPKNIDIKNYETTSGRKIKLFSNKFYKNLNDIGINLSVPLKDKNEISIKDENDNNVNENTVTNKTIKISKNIVEGINTIVRVNDQTIENDVQEISQEGNYTVDVTYQNNDDKQTEKYNFIIDKTAPSITGVEQGKTYTHKVYPVIKDDNLEKVETTINGETKDINLENGIEEEGIYQVVATDKARNTTSVSFQIVEPSDEDYKFKEDKILNISADTNKEKFSQMANIDVNYKIIRNSKELSKEESIATGDILQMESGQEYKLIVKGDVNYDGVVNIKDVIELRKYLLMKNNLNEVEQLAADTDLDGKTIGIKDLVRMRIIVLTHGIM